MNKLEAQAKLLRLSVEANSSEQETSEGVQSILFFSFIHNSHLLLSSPFIVTCCPLTIKKTKK